MCVYADIRMLSNLNLAMNETANLLVGILKSGRDRHRTANYLISLSLISLFSSMMNHTLRKISLSIMRAFKKINVIYVLGGYDHNAGAILLDNNQCVPQALSWLHN